ncbi:hypothetical protein [Natronococcus wangiae]|uniref:hypothetical protein n=1 Tax=Natronococcus wangiae TaxID=3068275 RepID=UPI00273EC395|nr:hypothetical protein [Natronococcus sp. AD5]
MNRRRFTLGIGGAIATGGAALGSGAFTQTDVDRSFDIAVEGDSTAYLSLSAGDITANTNAIDFDGGTQNNLLQVTLDETLGSADGSGVNANATTAIGAVDDMDSPTSVTDSAFQISNDGDREVLVSVDDDGAGIVELFVEGEWGANTASLGPAGATDQTTTIELFPTADDTVSPPEPKSANVVLLVRTPDDTSVADVDTVTITAEASDV